MTDNLERILCIDDEFGEVKAGEIAFFRGGEYAATMAPPNIEQELEEFLAAVDHVLQKRTGQGIRYTRRWQQNGMNVFVVIHAEPEAHNEQTAPEVPVPPRPSDLTPSKRMAEQLFGNAITFWWPEPAPGTLFVLWDNGTWESMPDRNHPGQTGFEWLAEHYPAIGNEVKEQHDGMGLVRKGEGGAWWIVAPSDLAIFVLLDNNTWQLAET